MNIHETQVWNAAIEEALIKMEKIVNNIGDPKNVPYHLTTAIFDVRSLKK